jgi:hypothetical protein
LDLLLTNGIKDLTNSTLITSDSGRKYFGIPISGNKHYAILADEFKLEINTKKETESLAFFS